MSIAEQLPGQLLKYVTDTDLLSQVLRPYRSHCQYLKSAVVEAASAAGPRDQVTASAEFEIEESCYIDDTGHFNSVEFNICYNQLAYYLIAKSIKDGLLDIFRNWTLDDFWRLQLGNILITDFRSTFKRQMRGRQFSGAVSVLDVVKLEKNDRWDPLIVIHMSCRYWDEAGGHCRGEVKIAISNPVGSVDRHPQVRPLLGRDRRTLPRCQSESTREGKGPMTAYRPAVTKLLLIPRPDRRAVLESLVSNEFKRAMLMSAEDELPVDENYFDLGLTSLRATEVKQRIEAEFGCELDTSLLFGSPTVKQIVDHIAGVALPDIFTAKVATADLLPASAPRPLIDELIKDLYGA